MRSRTWRCATARRRRPKARARQSWARSARLRGAIIGGGLGQILVAGSQIGAGLKLMQYSREFERQADLLGAQILARAGYDPREMANMFRTIEKESGGGGPEWMSSHPNPGNRYNAIIGEAKSLRVQGNANTGQFQIDSGAPGRHVASADRGADRARAEDRRWRDGSDGTADAHRPG